MADQATKDENYPAVSTADALMPDMEHGQRSQSEHEAIKHTLKRFRRESGTWRRFQDQHRRRDRECNIERKPYHVAHLKRLERRILLMDSALSAQ